jgi:hypothetical protein
MNLSPRHRGYSVEAGAAAKAKRMHKGSLLKRSSVTGAALLAAAVLAAPGLAQQGEDADGADETRSTVSCLKQPDIRRATILSNRNIVFVTRFEEIYNNELPKQCPGLQRKSLVNYPITNGRLCAGDRFQVLLEQGGLGQYVPAAMCPLGTFVRITAAELEDLETMTDQHRTRGQRGRSSREAVTTEQVELPPAAPPATPPDTGEPAPGQ